MSLSTQPVKGARDFYPEDMRLRTYMFDIWRNVCEQFGYEEYDAPILEPTDLYTTKGNEEIINEQTYSFEDRSGRSLTLRTEMTPTVSRMVAARRQEMGYPARLYSIPQCWRYERMQRGRGREFYQLNVDIFGGGDLPDDLEVIQISDAIMQAFKAKRDMYSIQVNSRKLTKYFFWELLQIRDTQYETLVRLIDKIAKMERAEFMGLLDGVLTETQRNDGLNEQIMAYLESKSLADLPEQLKGSDQVAEISRLLDLLNKLKITNAVFVPSLVRGFDYYTDIIFEVVDTDPSNNRSMFGGGRYDGLVGVFGVEPVPTVGFGMGDITLLNFLEAHSLVPDLKPSTDVYVAFIGVDVVKGQGVVTQLREMGLNVAVDTTSRKVEKQIRSAEKLGISHVLFVGQKEIEEELYSLKNLESGADEKLSLQRIASIVKDYRK